MPIISQFYGILIYMYRELGGNHNKPHIHIKYNEYEMTMDFKGNTIKGEFPKNNLSLYKLGLYYMKKN